MEVTMSPSLQAASLHSNNPQLSFEECEYLCSITKNLQQATILSQQVLEPQPHAVKEKEVLHIVKQTGIEKEKAQDVLLVTRGNLEEAMYIVEKIMILHKKTSPENIRRLQNKHPELSEIEAKILLEATSTSPMPTEYTEKPWDETSNLWNRHRTYEEEAKDDAVLQASYLFTGYTPNYAEIQRLREKYSHVELQTIEQILESTQGDVNSAKEIIESLVDTYRPSSAQIEALQSKFPQIDKASIISILESAAGDLTAAEETASVVASEIIPEQGHYHIKSSDDSFTLIKPHKNSQRSAKKNILTVEPQTSLEKSTRFSSIQSSPWKNVNPTVVAKTAEPRFDTATAFRNKAQEVLTVRSDLYEKAARAYRTGGRMGGAIAAYYADEARAQTKLMQSLNAQAAQSILGSASTASKLDLHGLHASEIISIVSSKLNGWYQSAPGSRSQTFEVITGVGIHSDTGARLRPVLISWLRNSGWKYREHAGSVDVTGK